MRDIITKCSNNPSYRSDHSMIQIQFAFNNFQKRRGIWKFNNSLLKQNDYPELINRIIHDEKVKYGIRVYDIKYLLMRITGEAIKYASILKKSINRKEISLLKDNDHLESVEKMVGTTQIY